MLRAIDRILGRGVAVLPLLAACASLPALADEDRTAAPVEAPSRLLYEEIELGDGALPRTVDCRVQVDYAWTGRPESISTDRVFCPEPVASEIRKTVRDWRWDARGRGGSTTVDVVALRLSPPEAEAAQVRARRPPRDGSQLRNGLWAGGAVAVSVPVGAAVGALGSLYLGIATCGGSILDPCDMELPVAIGAAAGPVLLGTGTAVAVTHRRSQLPVGLVAAGTMTVGMYYGVFLPIVAPQEFPGALSGDASAAARMAGLVGPPVITGLVAGAVRRHPQRRQLPLWQVQLGTTPDGASPTLGLSRPL